MNTLRNKLKEQYSQIPNELITDLLISAGALRVLLYLFTKPNNWNVYNLDIQKQLNISDKTLAKYWKELLASKWLRRTKRPPSAGKIAGGYIYQIGNFAFSEESSKKEESGGLSNNKPNNKKETTAEEVYLAYTQNIKASKSKQKSLNNINKWLREYKKEDLIKAINNYKCVADKQTEKKFIKECSNFFGLKDTSMGFFKDFLTRNKLAEQMQVQELKTNTRYKERPTGVVPAGHELRAITDGIGNIEYWVVIVKEYLI